MIVPEEQSTAKWLTPLWEVMTKVVCDRVMSMVCAFKPVLEESFHAREDILNANSSDLLAICVTER